MQANIPAVRKELKVKTTASLFNGGWIYGGLLPHFFVFDFFGNFHFVSMKNLLEVLRSFPFLNLGGKKFEKKSAGWPSRDLKSAVVTPHKSNY